MKNVISKQEKITGRKLHHSIISDATVYNFREDRTRIRNYDTWRMRAFFDFKDDSILIKRLLFIDENFMDTSVSDWDIEEFRWGHYVKNDFIIKVKEILSNVEYTEDVDDILILLLTYKYFIKFTYSDVELLEFGDLDLIDFMLKYNPENFPASNLVVYPGSIKTEFSSSASTLVHALMLKFSESAEFEPYINLRNRTMEEYTEIKKLVSILQGSDRGITIEYLRRRVVRILYLSLRKCQVIKQEKLFVVGELISLVDSYKSAFNSDTYTDLTDFYSKRLRSLVSDLKKVQSVDSLIF